MSFESVVSGGVGVKRSSGLPISDAVQDFAVLPRRKAGQTSPPSDRVPVTLTREVLSQYFGMPLTSAAKRLGICATAVKKVCRKLGIMKWPFRDRHLLAIESSNFARSEEVPEIPTKESCCDNKVTGKRTCEARRQKVASKRHSSALPVKNNISVEGSQWTFSDRPSSAILRNEGGRHLPSFKGVALPIEDNLLSDSTTDDSDTESTHWDTLHQQKPDYMNSCLSQASTPLVSRTVCLVSSKSSSDRGIEARTILQETYNRLGDNLDLDLFPASFEPNTPFVGFAEVPTYYFDGLFENEEMVPGHFACNLGDEC